MSHPILTIVESAVDLKAIERQVQRAKVALDDADRIVDTSGKKHESAVEAQRRARVDLGRQLAEARDTCPHGEWLPFLKRCGIEQSTAWRWMKLAGYSEKSCTPDAPHDLPQGTKTNEGNPVNCKTDEKNGKQMTPAEQKAKALDLFSNGVRKSDIATALGVDWGVVSRWIADPESEASTRGYGSTQAKAADEAEIVALFDEGKGVIEIAQTLGVSKHTVSRALKNLGLGRAGEKSVNPLIDHIRRADAEVTAWGVSADTIVALASISQRSDVDQLVSLLGDLASKISKLKTRLNKEVGKDR